MPQKEKTLTLAKVHSTLKTDNEVANINPFILFSRLILLAEREEETTPCFGYELTNYPFSLFKELLPAQKINNIQIEVEKFCPTFLSHKMKNG